MPEAQPLTVATALEWVAGHFSQNKLVYGHGTDSAWDEAVLLVLSCLNLPDDESVLQHAVSAEQWTQIESLVRRRVTDRVPLPYLLGRCQYAGSSFRVDSSVLVPRSPIGPWLLEHGAQWLPQAPRRILDLCTGCGCLGIVAAKLFPAAQVVLTDLDSAALQLAHANVREHGLQQRALVVQADGARALALSAQFDLVLCNPPYVNAPDMAQLPAEYLHEPRQALAAGADGLGVISPVLERLPGLLSSQGLFLGEVGRSAQALGKKHPQLPWVWLDVDHPGEGVFALAAADLDRLA